MEKTRFYYCTVCGNIIEKIKDSGNDLECCARTMNELIPGTTDGKVEFHVPVYEIKDGMVHVKVGTENHPMEKEHYIEWVEIVTDKGMARKYFKPGDAPEASFSICENEKICGVYAYCNKHKLWKNIVH